MEHLPEYIFAGQTLQRKDAAELLGKVIDGVFNQSQSAAFLTVFRIRNVTAAELLGFRDALLARCQKFTEHLRGTVDLCGTGGDGKNSFNVSTIVAFVVAACGVPVTKHGNYKASSSCGSSDLLEALGVPLSKDTNEVMSGLETAKVAFLHAPFWHPALKNLAPLRRELGFRTVFNLLGPLVNPVQPEFQLVGLGDERSFASYKEALELMPVEFALVREEDGFDEIALTSKTQVATRGSEEFLNAESFGMKSVLESEIKGGASSHESAILAEAILSGQGTRAQQDVVVANAALALRIAKVGSDLRLLAEYCREAIKSGAAKRVLEKARNRKSA